MNFRKIFNGPLGEALGIPKTEAPAFQKTPGGGLHSEGGASDSHEAAAAQMAKEFSAPNFVVGSLNSPSPLSPDDFERKWHFVRHRMEAPARATIDEIVRRTALQDFRQNILDRLAPIQATAAKLNAQKALLTKDNVHAQVIAAERTKQAHVNAGRPDLIERPPIEDHLVEEMETEKKKVRAQLEANATLAHPILREWLAALGEAAREITEVLEQEDRARYEAWSFPYPGAAHNPIICLVAWIGLLGTTLQADNLGKTQIDSHLL